MNDGKWWERRVARELRRLERVGLLRAVRVRDPWARVGAGFRTVRNPWGDFAGCYRGGRLFVLECKFTAGDRFRIGATLPRVQLDALLRWESWGAAVWVLWCAARVRYYAARPGELLAASERTRKQTLRADAFRRIGGGRVLDLWSLFVSGEDFPLRIRRKKTMIREVG